MELHICSPVHCYIGMKSALPSIVTRCRCCSDFGSRTIAVVTPPMSLVDGVRNTEWLWSICQYRLPSSSCRYGQSSPQLPSDLEEESCGFGNIRRNGPHARSCRPQLSLTSSNILKLVWQVKYSSVRIFLAGPYNPRASCQLVTARSD